MELIAGLPLIPFVHTVDDLLLLFYVMARISGLFLVAPLFSNKTVNATTRMVLIVFSSVLISMTIFPNYRGPSPLLQQPVAEAAEGLSALLLAINIGKEMLIGYLIGFCFSILFEAALLAGQMIALMMGLSMAEMLDPVSGVSQSIIGQFFTITLSLMILIFDFHHIFISLVAESFTTLPLGQYQLSTELLQDITHGSSRLFHYALQYSAIPYIVLSLVTLALGFMARIMPEMNIFMVGFPLKIFIGYYSLIAAIGYFPLVFQEAFTEYLNMANRVLIHLGGSG